MNRDGAIALASRAVAQLDTAFENSQAGNTVSAGILEEIGRKSSYSLEDLPSNRIGVEIARRFLSSLSEGELAAAAASGDPASYLMEHNAAGLLAVQKSLLASLGNYVDAQELHDLREPHSMSWVDPATGSGGTGGRSATVWFRGQSNVSTSPLWHPLFAPIDRAHVPGWLTVDYGSEAGCSFGVFEP